MILCWGEGHGSAIHDHADAHCFMKMLKGELREVRYAWPTNSEKSIEDETANLSLNEDDDAFSADQLQEISTSSMETNGVCYINGTFWPFAYYKLIKIY